MTIHIATGRLTLAVARPTTQPAHPVHWAAIPAARLPRVLRPAIRPWLGMAEPREERHWLERQAICAALAICALGIAHALLAALVAQG